MNVEMNEPAVHENSGEGNQDTGNLEVEAVFGVEVCGMAAVMEVGYSAAEHGAGNKR